MGITTDITTTHYNFVDGQWVPSVSGDVFENRNPADTNDLVGVFQKSSSADVAQIGRAHV